ncbi:MAG: PEGA domain-containing protein [Vicinamibacterales bacterium]
MLHQIGSGVLGPVFRTYEPQRDRLIAVKAFRLDLVPEDVARLADALRRLVGANLAHPSLVPAVDAGLEGTMAFLAMDYIAGETLDVAFRHLAPAPLDRALPVLSQVADALEAGWAAKLGHGALHPRDIFLTAATNDARVTGVGIVPALESTGIKAPVRRPYTAPERAAGEAWDIRADVYSLGAIAHELLTRRRPAAAGEQDGALATGLTPEQRVSIRRALAAALAERPEYRFASPGAFVGALAAIARGETPELPPEPAPATAPAPALVEKPPAPRKRTVATPPLLEVIETPPVEAPAAPSPAPAPVAPPPVPLEAPPAISLSEFQSEGRPEPVAAAAPIVPRSRIEPVEPFSSRARSVPPPFFGSAEPPAPAFPWMAVIAASIACLAVGGVGGYAVGRRSATASTVAAEPPRPPSSDTDVRVAPPPPAVTPVAEVTPAATPAASPKVPERGTPAAKPAPSGGHAVRPADTGSIVVDSRPHGARVLIDGRAAGTTPLRVPAIGVGSHAVRIEMTGYKAVTTTVIVKGGVEASVKVSLEEGRLR